MPSGQSVLSEESVMMTLCVELWLWSPVKLPCVSPAMSSCPAPRCLPRSVNFFQMRAVCLTQNEWFSNHSGLPVRTLSRHSWFTQPSEEAEKRMFRERAVRYRDVKPGHKLERISETVFSGQLASTPDLPGAIERRSQSFGQSV